MPESNAAERSSPEAPLGTPPGLPLAPMVDDIGVAVVEHGERGYRDSEHPMACLCGQFDPYYECDGPGVERLVLNPADFDGHA